MAAYFLFIFVVLVGVLNAKALKAVSSDGKDPVERALETLKQMSLEEKISIM